MDGKPARKPHRATASHTIAAPYAVKGITPVPAACRALLAAMPVAVLWLDRHGTVRRCNERAVELLGEPLLGSAWRELVHQRFRTGATDAGLTLTNGVPVAVTINPYAGGQLLVLTVHGATAAAVDREQRQARLMEIGKLAAGLAHQLRTPIAAAQVYLDLARDTGNPIYFEQTQTALDSLTRHTESLLTLARGEIQRDAHITTTELLDFTARQAQPLLVGRELRITNQWPEARLRCNQHLLTGVLLNLIENAAQASAADARVELHCRRSATVDAGGDRTHSVQWLELAIVDAGCGIAPAVCAQLGEPLLTARPDGTGLGLTMARLIVERHGGQLRIASTPGRGTIVSVCLLTTQALVPDTAKTLAIDQGSNAA